LEADVKLIAVRLGVFALLIGAYLLSPVAGLLALGSGAAYTVWQRKRPLSARS
jgi:hypothetical protein